MPRTPPKQHQDGPTLRIDMDFVVYRAAQQAETEIDWGDHLTTIQSDRNLAREIVERELLSLQKRFHTPPDRCVLYFTDSVNFRKTVDPEYKGKRTKRKPVGYRSLVDYCKDNYKSYVLPSLEADDVLGITCHGSEEDFILVSPDKDMKQLACRQYNFDKEFTVTLEEADTFFYTQILTGDPVDGYKGLPGCGPVNAAKLLDKPGDPWEHIVKAYEAKGLTESDALHQARLARILRPGEYNFETFEPILWSPTT